MPSSLGPLDGRPFAAVVFDMDGTLIDSTAVVVRSWVRWAQEHDVDPRRLQGFHGVPAAAIVAELLPAHRHEDAVARITELELGDTDGIDVLPGAAEALAALAPDRSAIATSCTAPLASARIAASGLVAPRVLVTADDVERGKPHPDPVLLAAERLGVDPRDCLVVEDAPGGLAAARAAGCSTLAVVTTTPREELVEAADAVVTDLSHVAFTHSGGGVLVSSA
jgi:sugar-phosphatase